MRLITMTNHRYTQIIVPIDRYLNRLTPKAKKLVVLLEGGLLLALFTSIVFDIN
jgi:hypothetical protein